MFALSACVLFTPWSCPLKSVYCIPNLISLTLCFSFVWSKEARCSPKPCDGCYTDLKLMYASYFCHRCRLKCTRDTTVTAFISQLHLELSCAPHCAHCTPWLTLTPRALPRFINMILVHKLLPPLIHKCCLCRRPNFALRCQLSARPSRFLCPLGV
jgi:hypothetical protein